MTNTIIPISSDASALTVLETVKQEVGDNDDIVVIQCMRDEEGEGEMVMHSNCDVYMISYFLSHMLTKLHETEIIIEED